MISRRARAAATLAAVGLLAACSSAPSAAPGDASSSSAASSLPVSSTSAAPTTSAPAAGLPTPQHVVVVVFENHAFGSVLGAPDAPYLTALAGSGTTLTDAHGVRHPSQPNYLALFSGSTQGVVSDRCPLSFTAPNLAAQLHRRRPHVRRLLRGPAGRRVHRLLGRRATPASTTRGSTSRRPGRGQPAASAFPDRLRDAADRLLRHPEPVQRHARLPGGHRRRLGCRRTSPATSTGRSTHDSLLIVTFDEDDNTARQPHRDLPGRPHGPSRHQCAAHRPLRRPPHHRGDVRPPAAGPGGRHDAADRHLDEREVSERGARPGRCQPDRMGATAGELPVSST